MFKKVRGYALIVLLIISLMILGVYFVLSSSRSKLISFPRIIEVGRFTAVISWETDKPSIGKIYYTDENGQEMTAETVSKSKLKKVTLGGLKPETVYSYRLSSKGKNKYSFKTAPMFETPFRFMVYDSKMPFENDKIKHFSGVVESQYPEIAFLTGEISGEYMKTQEELLNSFEHSSKIPYYVLPQKQNLSSEKEKNYYIAGIPKNNNDFDYVFDYGNSRFVILGPDLYSEERINWINNAVKKDEIRHVFIIINQPKNSSVNEEIKIIANKNKVDAVFYSSKDRNSYDIESTKYIEMNNDVYIVDVDGEGVAASTERIEKPDIGELLIIRETPESVKKTCVYCRKLLEDERYRESIQWYRNFIDEFGKKHIVDDAQFEIANIYDRNLFEYKNAVYEYKNLIKNYPESTYIRSAKNRLEYLSEFSDNDYVPLEIFEKARTVTYQKDEQKAVLEVESILAKYPNTKMEKQVLFWLGYTLTDDDAQKAGYYFNKIIEKYPDSETQKEALTALGDLYYSKHKYNESIMFYEKAIEASGDDLSFGIRDKIWRCHRNKKRDVFLIISILLVLTGILSAFLLKPKGFIKREIMFMLILFGGYIISGGIIWSVFAAGYPELIKLILVISSASSICGTAAVVLTRKKLSLINPPIKSITTGIIALLLTLAAVYIVLYAMHYLRAFYI